MCSESENILWGICDVCKLALTVAKTSSHYDRFAISVPARLLILFDLAQQDGNISDPKRPRGTRGNGDITEARFILWGRGISSPAIWATKISAHLGDNNVAQMSRRLCWVAVNRSNFSGRKDRGRTF